MKLLCKLPRWLGEWTGHRFGRARDMDIPGPTPGTLTYAKQCLRCGEIRDVKRRKPK